jgi:lipoprotein-anchoring transpeptidase ErfK/SrfK
VATRPSGRWATGTIVAALALALAASGCASSADVARGEASGPATTLPLPVTLPRPVTTPVPATTLPPTTTTTEPSTCSPDEEPGDDGQCYAVVAPAPPTTFAPPVPAAPDPAPPLAAPVQALGNTQRGPAVAAAQQRLLDLGFWHAGVNGNLDWTTSQAVMAFQKHIGYVPASGKLDQRTADALNGATTKVSATANLGTLIEVDKAKQVLYIIRDGKTIMALNTSTGSGVPYVEQNQRDPEKVERGDSKTPSGWFRVFRENSDGWVEGDLGRIYRPKTFNGGIAVHGMTNVPNRPASHGCVRVSLPAMDMIWAENLMPVGVRVWVHGPDIARA